MHSLIDIARSPTGHEKQQSNGQWEAVKYGIEIHSNGKMPFRIPSKHHKRVADDYRDAKKSRTVSILYQQLGKEFGRNGGTADIRTVTSYVKGIVKAQGGEV